MITAGIDMGAKFIKVLLLKDGKVLAMAQEQSGFEPLVAAERAFENAISRSGIAKGDINYIFATGAGRSAVPFANDTVTEVSASAKGVLFLHPSVRTIIEVGAEEGRAIKCDEQGKVQDFAVNEKCAAGAGTFVEAMARALEIDVEEIGELSLSSREKLLFSLQSRLQSFMGQYGGLSSDITQALVPHTTAGGRLNFAGIPDKEMAYMIRLIRSKLMP